MDLRIPYLPHGSTLPQHGTKVDHIDRDEQDTQRPEEPGSAFTEAADLDEEAHDSQLARDAGGDGEDLKDGGPFQGLRGLMVGEGRAVAAYSGVEGELEDDLSR